MWKIKSVMKNYYLIRWVNCSNGISDIIGIVDNEELAKEICKTQPMFRKYEEVKLLDTL